MVDDGFPFFSSFGIYYSRLWLPSNLIYREDTGIE